MRSTQPASDEKNRSGSRGLIVLIFAVIVAAFLAFLLLRPSPSGSPVPRQQTTTPAPAKN